MRRDKASESVIRLHTNRCNNKLQKAYSIDHEPPPKQYCVKNGKHPNGRASAYADLQQHRSEGIHRRLSPVSNYVPQPDYLEGEEDEDLIKPKKLVNPVKASKSHQELHRELMSSCKRGHGVSVEMKPELQRVLESRKRDQLIKQRKQEEEAHRKISPLEAELLKRHRKLEELERQQEKEQQENLKAPEFVKVKENLRRTSIHSKEEKEV
ncbi:protein FAM107B isoform X1 [Dicentrarchus labrax]|uniref:protein FAM107B isoform X1 n=1 Tax=Dicentrarchus labrax TaxID=13489 RepID=UPI0021F5CC32|nr:protein FAM107B isoform X1 [Dicentrarchus labrax]